MLYTYHLFKNLNRTHFIVTFLSTFEQCCQNLSTIKLVMFEESSNWSKFSNEKVVT